MDLHNSKLWRSIIPELLSALFMDLHNWIMDLHNWIMDLHNWIMDLHNWIMEIHK